MQRRAKAHTQRHATHDRQVACHSLHFLVRRRHHHGRRENLLHGQDDAILAPHAHGSPARQAGVVADVSRNATKRRALPALRHRFLSVLQLI